MEREVVIQRTSTLLIALMMGYVLQFSNGLVLKLNEEGLPMIKNQDEFILADFPVDVKYLQRQAELMPDKDYLAIVNYVATGTCIGV